MATKRIPINRLARGPRFTAEAIEAFRRMHALESQCTCTADVEESCAACDAWWDHHRVLFHELRLKPWEFPAVQIPGTPPTYPTGREYPEAQLRYRALAA